ncbi:minor tail protein [Gordonia phage Sticker17]|nr:minor tail protein [Gordonia phage Sticker17]
MANPPREDIQRAFLEPTVQVIRRLEIYEEDGETPWRQDIWDDLLVSGSVSLDYNRDERRAFDVELDNSYGDLNPKAGELWYDKRFKLYYGIELNQSGRGPRVAIVEQYLANGQAEELKRHLSMNGITEVHYLPSATDYEHVQNYDVLVAISSTSIQKLAFLNQCYNRGKGIVTFSNDQTSSSMPSIIGNAGVETVVPASERNYAPIAGASDLSVGWDDWSTDDVKAFRKVLAPASGAKTIATVDDGTGQWVGAVAREDSNNRRWVHTTLSHFGEGVLGSDYESFGRYASRIVSWTSAYEALDFWEIQLGEFMADSISVGGSYATVSISGRDLTKLCQQSKFVTSTTFTKDTPIESVVKTVATNAGISKFRLPITGKALDKDMTWERDTARWDVIRDVSNSNSYEVFFDNEGYLVMREFRDPLTTPATLELSTGVGGNLVSRGGKTSDSNLFNHIVVVGESSDSSTPPVYAEAINTSPTSPTSVSEIGDRVSIITSSLVTTIAKAQEYADALLAVSALEEFELSFESTLLPWIEVGDIVEMARSDDRYWGPDRYLLTSLSFPLDLSPMSGSGKRTEKVEG